MSEVPAVCVFDQPFYDLTKEVVEANSPAYLRKIIRTAFDNVSSGMGPGPSFQEVIDHYESQANYLVIRGIITTPDVHEALDRLLTYRYIDAGVSLWKLPSIVEGSKDWHYVGKYNFKLMRGHLDREIALVKDAGWDI